MRHGRCKVAQCTSWWPALARVCSALSAVVGSCGLEVAQDLWRRISGHKFDFAAFRSGISGAGGSWINWWLVLGAGGQTVCCAPGSSQFSKSILARAACRRLRFGYWVAADSTAVLRGLLMNRLFRLRAVNLAADPPDFSWPGGAAGRVGQQTYVGPHVLYVVLGFWRCGLASLWVDLLLC